MNIAVVIYSRLRAAENTVDYICFEGNASQIYLNASMFTQIICDPA